MYASVAIPCKQANYTKANYIDTAETNCISREYAFYKQVVILVDVI